VRALAVSAVILALVAGQARAAQAPPAAPPAPEEPVVGLSFRGVHRAYPLRLFAQRQVLNDTVSRQEVAVFHDPQRGLVAAWFRCVHGEPLEFSGTAPGAVADDLTTVTRWDLTTGVAVGGNLAGQRLVPLPVTRTTWGGWLAAHPNAVLFAAAAEEQ
jgi:hypothetical protein